MKIVRVNTSTAAVSGFQQQQRNGTQVAVMDGAMVVVPRILIASEE